jgi:sugar-specific transcriptional regulator TrmB
MFTIGGEMGLANSSEYIELLTHLGLTLNEARVFLALSGFEESTAKAISKTSGVAREVVYQIMPKLEKKGLVEEIVTIPKTFKAMPMEDTFAILFKRRKEESRMLLARAKEAIKKQQSIINSHTEESQITVVPPREEDPHWKKAWCDVQKAVDLIMPLNKFLQWPQHYAEVSLDGVIKRKVRVRMVTQKEVQKVLASPPENFSPSLVRKLMYINFKFTADSSPVEMVVFDKKTMFVSTHKEKHIKDMTWLCSNNPFLVELAKGYFENLWFTSTKR